MKLVVSLGVLGFMLAATAPAHAQSDPESAQLLCDLTGDCAAEVADPNAAQSDPAAEPVRGEPRGGNTRGFSFQRAGTPTAQRTTRVANASANATIPATVRPTRPAQVGAADLGLTFLPNSSNLTDAAKARLARYAGVLAGPKLGDRRLRIEGHTDASGSAALNRDLSRRRAQAVADFLIGSGVDRRRLDVVGYGSSRPLPGKAASAPENRRVMAVLL